MSSIELIYGMVGACVGAGVGVVIMLTMKWQDAVDKVIPLLLIAMLIGFFGGKKYAKDRPRLGHEELAAAILYLPEVKEKAPEIYVQVLDGYEDKADKRKLKDKHFEIIEERLKDISKTNLEDGEFPETIQVRYKYIAAAYDYFAKNEPEFCDKMANDNDILINHYEGALPPDVLKAKAHLKAQRIIRGPFKKTMTPDAARGARLYNKYRTETDTTIKTGVEHCQYTSNIHTYFGDFNTKDFYDLEYYGNLDSSARNKVRYMTEAEFLEQSDYMAAIKDANPIRYDEIIQGRAAYVKNNTISKDDIDYFNTQMEDLYLIALKKMSAETIRTDFLHQIWLFKNLREPYPQMCTQTFNGRKNDRQKISSIIGKEYGKRYKEQYVRNIASPYRIARQIRDPENGDRINQKAIRKSTAHFNVRDTNPIISETVGNIEAHRKTCDMTTFLYESHIKLSDSDLMDVWAEYYGVGE